MCKGSKWPQNYLSWGDQYFETSDTPITRVKNLFSRWPQRRRITRSEQVCKAGTKEESETRSRPARLRIKEQLASQVSSWLAPLLPSAPAPPCPSPCPWNTQLPMALTYWSSPAICFSSRYGGSVDFPRLWYVALLWTVCPLETQCSVMFQIRLNLPPSQWSLESLHSKPNDKYIQHKGTFSGEWWTNKPARRKKALLQR